MEPRQFAQGERRGRRREGERLISEPVADGRWLIPLWLCLCAAGGCSGQVYNLSLAVDERLPADTLVGDISAGLPPGEGHPGGFFLSEGSGESAVLADFHVHTDTGIIRTARPLDRERRARYSFVAATLRGEMVQVEITVTDVNDHAPRFPRESVRLNVSELSPPGSAFRLPAARDPDAGSFGTQGYSLLPQDQDTTADRDREESPFFQLRYGIPPDTLDLMLLRRLDRERADTHRLLVEAWDGGSPRRSGRLRVEIRVVDENDNAPAFGQSEYRARVREDAPTGSSVCRVLATDPDLGVNGEVRYSLSRRQGDPSAASYFEVEERTGLLSLIRPLDREVRAIHRLAVEARDGGAQPEVATALVAVEVLDVNDNVPAIHLLYLTETGASVSEGARPGDYVARVSVSDPDEQEEEERKGEAAPRGGVALSLQGGEGAFSLRSSSGDSGVYFLCVEGPLDRERCDVYELRLVAVDSGAPPLSSQRALVIRVADLNDQAPAFAQPRYRAAVSEAASPGTVVLRLSASDADEPGSPNAQVRYALGPHQTQGALFHLDPLSGVLSIQAGLDHEREAALEVLVLARDLGEPPMSASCLVSVSVEDANDNEPVFEHRVYNASLAEHAKAGYCLLQVKATDRDSGNFGHIEYFLYDGFHDYEKSKAFQIDLNSGHICVSQDIDREEDPSIYDLLVKAIDGGGLSAQAFVHIEIEDINDNHPVFDPVTYMTSISNHTQPGTEIISVVATDKDSGIYGVVIYELLPGDLSSLFTVDASTGIVYLISALSNVEHSSVLLIVSARDGGGLFSVVNAVVTLRILQTAVAPAVFERSRYTFSIPEDAPEGSAVGTVKAREPLSEIINWVALDYEEQAQHHLFALVTDHGVLQHNVTVSAYISVTDVNDNHPYFPQLLPGAELHVKVLEGQPAGTLVATIFAKDLDSGNNGLVLYSLSSGESLGHFQIDSSSSELRTTEALLYNWHSSYRMVITATDQGIPPLQGQIVINIEIIPLPKGKSVPFQNIRHLVIPENFRPAQMLCSLKLPSQHPHFNNKQHFSIFEEDSHVPFEIDNASGDLFLSKELDYETASHYFLRVVVNDYLNSPPWNDTVFLSIDVEDQNDHSPAFQDDFVVIGIEENVPVGTLVYTFNAKDGDGSFLNSNLQYSIRRNDFTENPFLIHPSYGNVITAVPLDRETTPVVVLTVLAADQVVNVSDRRQSSLTAKIVILDVNDNHPTFVSSPLSYVREDAEVGSLVHHIVAQDPDLGRNGQVTYHLLSNNTDHAFVIDKNSGLLTTVFALDHECQEHYNLTVVALDNGTPALSATQSLIIIVVDVNDEVPMFTKSLYESSICENEVPGAVVIKVEATDKDSGINSLLQYEILSGPGYEFFQINQDTGEITTAISLDRETQDIFTIKVLVQDSGTPILSSTASIVFRVLDENDHTPKFLLPVSKIQIMENQEPSTVSTVLAIDKDAAGNGTVQYRIIGGNVRGYFALHKTSGDLFTTCSLDREIVSNFTLVIECFDLGSPPRSSVTQLHITVLDENDNSPLFARNHYQTSVREDLEEGSAVLELFAADADEGPNGEVTYSLTEDMLGAFTIDRITGVIFTTKLLDRERKPQYVFKALATDSGILGPRSTSVTVIVHIEDVNDNSPFFLQNPVIAHIPSQAPINLTIATVRANDVDLGLNGAVTFRFVKPESMFQMDPNTGEIFLQEPLPLEGCITHLIVASDQGLPARTATALLAIYSEAQTEMISFSLTEYKATVPENSAIGTSVFTVAAYNRSLMGKNLKHTVIGEHEDIFDIHPIMGEITVKQAELLDYEVRKKVHFAVLAENGLTSAVCGVTVLIQDMNDNAPQFEQNYFKTSVWEGQAFNTYIMQIYATDDDTGINGEIEYSVISGNTNEAFLIDSAQGIISTNTILDREDISSYRLVVQAVDKGSPRLSATSTVEIQVVDINDNIPTIQPLGIVELPENAPLGFLVMQVSADDADLGPPLHYSFAEDGNLGMKFAIDQYKGIITLVKALDFEETTRLELLIRVSDSVHQTTEQLLIFIFDINDNPPVFTQDAYLVMIPEHRPITTSILTVCATDKDSEDNGKLSYRISPSSDTFSVDPQNGSLYLVKTVTYQEKNSVIQLHVEASDRGNPPLSAITSVVIQIQDVNNYTPQFTVPAYNLSISENVSIGERLLTFSAVDYDRTHDNTYVDYAIIGGNGSNKFQMEKCIIGPESPGKLIGNLVLRSVLDRERSSSYQLLILASDQGTPSLNSTATVSITVLDINDNPPVFTSLEYHVNVRENFPVGSHITAVSANDCDAGPNADITYSIISGNDKGHFHLDGKTGSLDLVRALDYEEMMKFSLTIQASDGGVGVKNVAFAVVFISILDANDYVPMFVFPSLDCRIHENLPAFSFVCTISALDFDTGPYGQLSYSIQSSCLSGHGTPGDHDMFFIDPVTGDILTKQVLDFEDQNKFCFIVQAKDRSNSTATVTVQVDVEGADEFDPVFNQDQYFFHFPENNEAGQLIGKVTASDYDGGLDGVIHYTLLKQSPFFSVNHSSGSLSLTRPFQRKRSSMKRTDDTLELLIKAHSPKLDSKSSTCTVLVNISNAPESYSMLPMQTVSISIASSTVAFLFLAISFAVLIVRFRQKEIVNSSVKKEMASPSPTDLKLDQENSAPKDIQKSRIHVASTLPVGTIAEWLSLVGIKERRDMSNPCRHSDSSGHGSAEGETAEDEEIKRINKYPCRKGSGSALSDRGSSIPDSGIPRDSDPLSCQSEETDVLAVSHNIETVQSFKYGSGGEGRECDTRYACNKKLSQTYYNMGIKEKDITTNITSEHIFIRDDQNSYYGSLATLVDSDEDLRGNYNWDYLLNWEPRFKPLASVFSDIAELEDENIKMHSFPKERKSFIFPPPLITSVAQPGLKTVPPQIPTLLPGQAFKKYPRSPLIHHLRYPPSAMTPSFSPSLSLLTTQTPTASPVISHPSLKGVCSGGTACELSTEVVQV
ncbi:protocadherin-23 isoform X2 [Rhineura floridana]|uniref:protocadherin-23 isoform X2 n=1 Tax=Rhineura floridana TaxID=261503 RepID=UPI002AC8855D|nr:protocadherin-23 isoform X2 [Rhineura floridana]